MIHNYLQWHWPLSPFWPLICSAGVCLGRLVPQLCIIWCLLYEKQNPLKFILQPKARQLIDSQTKLRKLQSAALIDGWTWKVACLFPLCAYSIKPRPNLAGINMHGDSLSPLFFTSVWSDTVCLFFFVCQGAIHLSTIKRVANSTSFSPDLELSHVQKSLFGNITTYNVWKVSYGIIIWMAQLQELCY